MRQKLLLLFIANLIGLNMMAEGYQINSQSVRQLGMGHVGAALKLGAESMLFNPAGLSFINSRHEVSLGVTTIFSKVEYEPVPNLNSWLDGSVIRPATTDNPMGTPIFGYAGLKLSERFAVGISITNPVGNSLVWPDNWSGSHFVQNISMQAFSIQPTLSYRICDILSVGAGLMVDFGNFALERGLIRIGGLEQIGALLPDFKPIIDKYGSVPPVTARLEGSSKVGYGVNAGILFTPTDRLSIGISYRSEVKMSVGEGTASLAYAGEDLKQVIAGVNQAMPGAIPIPPIDGKNFAASLPIPSNINLGIAYNFWSRLLLSAELQYVGWKAYDKLVIKFGPDVGDLALESVKNFKNSMIYRFGGELVCSEKFAWRFGAIYDSTPVDLELYGPETPGANKFSLTTGCTYRPAKALAIDFGFQALFGEKTLGSVPDSGALSGAFSGYYTSTALIPALGLRFNF